MQPDEIAEVRGRLDDFVEEVFASLPRKDQRGTGSLYLQGLMLEERRKSMQPMGGRLGVDYQQLQQFVSSSPWPVEPVRRVLARKAITLIEPEAWVIDDTGFKKDGTASPGVARHRRIVKGITYRYRTGTPWRGLPKSFGPWQTVWKRHRRFSGDGTWDNILTELLAKPIPVG